VQPPQGVVRERDGMPWLLDSEYPAALKGLNMRPDRASLYRKDDPDFFHRRDAPEIKKQFENGLSHLTLTVGHVCAGAFRPVSHIRTSYASCCVSAGRLCFPVPFVTASIS